MVDNKFKTLRCLEGKTGLDPLLDEIQRDVQANSVLEAMKSYIDELRGKLDNNARPYQKISRLFEAGLTPTQVVGHHDGVAVGLRTGDEHDLLASYGNFIGFVWGTTVGPVAPWVGKSFHPVTRDQLRDYTAGFEQGETPTYLGINHFEKVEDSILNKISLSMVTFLMHLKDAPLEERNLYGYDKNGGLFIARRAQSVYAGSKREVFQLNYRWHNLGSLPPISYLIDELVQVTDGVYLGQLLFATRNMLGQFDPDLPVEKYDYQHFGYFLLMDDSWASETRRVFPNIKPGRTTAHLEAPKQAEGRAPGGPLVSVTLPKFTTFTFADPVDGNCNDNVLAEIHEDMKRFETILDLLKDYSDQLMKNFDNHSPCFLKLHELFNRGVGPDEVRGFFRGAVVTFHAEGFYKFFNVNTLNVGWLLGRRFTPWTGKTFDPISLDRLKEITDGFEQGLVPTFWGTNTQSFKTTKQKFIGEMMKLAGVWTEEVPVEESKHWGYDAKCFFFIARKGASINEDNQGKEVFLFNYRWPKLKTLPPDNYCIDELVKIAEGLYLGQLIYATELLKTYDPREDPAAYQYRLFGYFLLMDEEWQRRRMEIGFDPYDI
ncbi:MAG: hypothetical protein LAO21_08850 [Acidobacteriia bacterium]|nr:hypothetical protein [Terriglobia bacterium]